MPTANKDEKKKEFLPSKMRVKEADANGDTGYVSGFVSVFDTIDQGMDIVHKGAFAASIKARKGVFPFLLDHNRYKPAGYSTKMEEQAKGVYYESEFKLHDPDVKQRYELAKLSLKLDTPMGNSFGYYAVKYDYEEVDTESGRHMVRNLREIMLTECSLLLFPMHESAGVTDAKEAAVKNLVALVESGTYSEEEMQKALAALTPLKPAPPAASVQDDPALRQSFEAFRNIFR